MSLEYAEARISTAEAQSLEHGSAGTHPTNRFCCRAALHLLMLVKDWNRSHTEQTLLS